MNIHRIALLLVLALITPARSNGVVIVIHGTWASGESWYLPGGDFFDVLEAEAHKLGHKVVPFTWTGALNDQARIQGAQALAKLILSYPPHEKKTIIAHSHGGNVAFYASKLLSDPVEKMMRNFSVHQNYSETLELVSKMFDTFCGGEKKRTLPSKNEQQVLNTLTLRTLLNACNEVYQAKQEYKKLYAPKTRAAENLEIHDAYYIESLYTLATPIDTNTYAPDMDVVKHVYNCYSKGDFVQPIFWQYHRLIPEHERIVNLRITIDKSGIFGEDNPLHVEMHEPVLGRWLLAMPDKLKRERIGGFESFSHTVNGKVHFDARNHPHFKVDTKTTAEREGCETERMRHAPNK